MESKIGRILSSSLLPCIPHCFSATTKIQQQKNSTAKKFSSEKYSAAKKFSSKKNQQQNRANTVEQPATVHSSLPALAFQKKKKIHFFLSRIEMGFFQKRTCSISDCLTNSLNRKEGWLRRKYETHNTHILCSMYCTLWVHGYMGKGQGYVRTKEINVSHIISVCLVVIARKRENILSRQKLLQVAFSRQDAIVQQQKSSADVKTAINVTNMTLVFLFLVMKMMGMARAIG